MMPDLDADTIARLLAATKAHAWPIVAALVVGVLVRVLKQDVRWTPTIPADYRPAVAMALGLTSGVCESVVAGVPLGEAMIRGGVSALLAMGSHHVVVEKLRGGRELGGPERL